MKIAIVHPYPIHSRAVGGVTRLYALVQYLAVHHQVFVFAHSSGDRRVDAEAIQDLAALNVVQQLFPLPSPSVWTRISWLFGTVPYFVSRNRNPKLEAALKALDGTTQLDVVHVEFAYLAPLLNCLSARPIRVLAEQETMSLSIARLHNVPYKERTLYEHFIQRQLTKVQEFERTIFPRFTRVYAISPVEAEHVQKLGVRCPRLLPHIVNTRQFIPPVHELQAPCLLFVGNYTHRPNLHGLLWFVQHVWPAMQAEAPQVRFNVVGPGLQTSQRQSLERLGVRVLGFVDNLIDQYYAATVFVNPLHSGGGMRGKVLEAFSCARAVVSTRIGMEGIAAQAGFHYLEGNNPAEFAQQIFYYLHDPSLRRTHGTAARTLIEECYDLAVVLSRLELEYKLAVAEHHDDWKGDGVR